MDEVSREHVVTDWSPDHFAVAYAFWAYAKAYGYAQTLPDEHRYVVHWLREHAMRADPAMKPQGDDLEATLFP